MKKTLLAVGLLLAACAPSFAFSFADIKNQVIDQTKLTIHKSGGIAGFYDASIGGNSALREGVIDHVLTNRFITLDLGWYGADNQEGILTGGFGFGINKFLSTVFPGTSETLGNFG